MSAFRVTFEQAVYSRRAEARAIAMDVIAGILSA
jgi:hypothetical protein